MVHPRAWTCEAELGSFFSFKSTKEYDLFCATILHRECEGLWHKADVRFFSKVSVCS